ncbi:MAG: DUF2971 domain-containing protein [Bacteroidia bacterium]
MKNIVNNSVYKFFSVNDNSLINLKNNQLFCNHYLAFNDPFECWCTINTGIPDPKKENDRFLNVIAVWGFTPDRRDDALEYYYDYLQAFEEDQINVDYHINTARISCFSCEGANLLMWAHYADGLRGFCIEFDSEKLISEQNEAKIIEVNYSKLPPVLEAISYPLANDIYWHAEDDDSDNAVDYMRDFYSKMLATKPIEWEYEKEARLIFHSKAENSMGELFSYPESAIKSVIIGEKMPEKNKKIIESILLNKNLSAKIKIAQRNRSNYTVLIN